MDQVDLNEPSPCIAVIIGSGSTFSFFLAPQRFLGDLAFLRLSP